MFHVMLLCFSFMPFTNQFVFPVSVNIKRTAKNGRDFFKKKIKNKILKHFSADERSSQRRLIVIVKIGIRFQSQIEKLKLISQSKWQLRRNFDKSENSLHHCTLLDYSFLDAFSNDWIKLWDYSLFWMHFFAKPIENNLKLNNPCWPPYTERSYNSLHQVYGKTLVITF